MRNCKRHNRLMWLGKLVWNECKCVSGSPELEKLRLFHKVVLRNNIYLQKSVPAEILLQDFTGCCGFTRNAP